MGTAGTAMPARTAEAPLQRLRLLTQKLPSRNPPVRCAYGQGEKDLMGIPNDLSEILCVPTEILGTVPVIPGRAASDQTGTIHLTISIIPTLQPTPTTGTAIADLATHPVQMLFQRNVSRTQGLQPVKKSCPGTCNIPSRAFRLGGPRVKLFPVRSYPPNSWDLPQ